MPKKLHVVRLTEDERATLLGIVHRGVRNARTISRARVLLLSNDGWNDLAIATALGIVRQTVERIRARFVLHGLETALYDRPRPGAARLLTPEDEALVVAITCSTVPTGRNRWTLQLIADELVALGRVAVSPDTIGRVLKTRS
jgi:transposase